MEPLPPSPFTCADAYRGKASRDSDSWSLALTQKLLSPGCASLEFQARHRSLRASGVPWRWDCPPSRSDPTSSARTWSCRRPPARYNGATRFSRRPPPRGGHEAAAVSNTFVVGKLFLGRAGRPERARPHVLRSLQQPILRLCRSGLLGSGVALRK